MTDLERLAKALHASRNWMTIQEDGSYKPSTWDGAKSGDGTYFDSARDLLRELLNVSDEMLESAGKYLNGFMDAGNTAITTELFQAMIQSILDEGEDK